MSLQPLSARHLAEWLADASRQPPVLLDVREDWEFEHCHIAGSRHVPMAMVPASLTQIDEDAAIVCICHHGMRSMQVAQFLVRQGCAQVFNLNGGVDAWALEIDPAMPRY